MIRKIWSELEVPLICISFIIILFIVIGVFGNAMCKYNLSNNAEIAEKYVEMHPPLKGIYETMLISGINNSDLRKLEMMALELSMKKDGEE